MTSFQPAHPDKPIQMSPNCAADPTHARRLGLLAAVQRSGDDDILDEIEWESEDDETLTHITEMRVRVCRWFEKFGAPVKSEPWIVGSERCRLDGHIDFVTEDTIWDLKVSATPPGRADVLQLLLYWVILQDDPDCNLTITHLGFFNPRSDTVWRVAIADITGDVMDAVEAIAASDQP